MIVTERKFSKDFQIRQIFYELLGRHKIKELKFDGDVKRLFIRCISTRELLKKKTRDLINMARRKRDKNVVGKCPYKFDI